MADRRRINGPVGGTNPPVYRRKEAQNRPTKNTENKSPRIFLKTGLTPSASGSAYIEVEESSAQETDQPTQKARKSSSKIFCTIHGPRPLPRSASFSPNLVLSTHVKFAPFATKQRRGYIRDSNERDLAAHLETALHGAIIGERWPKSGIDIVVAILEAEEISESDQRSDLEFMESGAPLSIALLKTLSHCITVASAAIVDAKIECVDLVVGGTAVLVKDGSHSSVGNDGAGKEVPYKITHNTSDLNQSDVVATVAIGYLPTRKEVSELWVVGKEQNHASAIGGKLVEKIDKTIDFAISEAELSQSVLKEAIKERLLHEAKRGNMQP